MTDSPLTTADLIAHVEHLRPGAGPLEHLADAARLGLALSEQSDAVLDHFIQAARAGGRTWAEIGEALGVSRQAAQQRFAARALARELLPAGHQLFSRFPQRAKNVIMSAWRHAVAGGGDAVAPEDIAAALLTEPESIAARAIVALGVTEDAYLRAAGTTPAKSAGGTGTDDLEDVAFSPQGLAVTRSALKAALALGHNYIGTEHLLLALVDDACPFGGALAEIGLTRQAVAEQVAALLPKPNR